MDITETLAPKSDQLNAEDLLTGARTVTVDKVTRGSVEQPVEIHLVEFPGRPFKPSKTVRRILVAAWGAEASKYTGRRMTLYRDPGVKFGGLDVGGIRVSHLSHIDRRVTLALTVTRGKRAPFVVDPLPDEPKPAQAKTAKPLADRAAAVAEAFNDAMGINLDQLEARVGSPRDSWTEADVESLTALGKAIKTGETTTYEEFETSAVQQESEAQS